MNALSHATTSASVLSPHHVALLAILAVLVLWLIVTLVAGYHWWRYTNRLHHALSVHVIVSLVCFAIAISGLIG